MKKLPLVLALSAAAICTSANAQSTVTVYGRLYPFVLQESVSGATAAGTPVATLAATPGGTSGTRSVKGMTAGNSRLGFRGQEDLGSGLKAKFQIEGTVAVDDGNAAGFRWNRETFVGLEGSFGSVRLGLIDTVHKEYGDTLGILGVSSATFMSSVNIMRKVGFGTSNASRFHERPANSIIYESPSFGGFEFGALVATAENPTPTLGSGETYSLGVKYDKGPI